MYDMLLSTIISTSSNMPLDQTLFLCISYVFPKAKSPNDKWIIQTICFKICIQVLKIVYKQAIVLMKLLFNFQYVLVPFLIYTIFIDVEI